MDKYVVLRKPSARRRNLENFASDDVETGPLTRRVEIEEQGPPRVEVQSLDASDLREARGDPEIDDIALVMPTTLIAATESANGSGDDWGLAATGAALSPFKGEGVVVAILDTGIDASHPAFQGVELIEKDFTADPPREGSGGAADNNGHGTHCAGTVFGRDLPDPLDPARAIRIGVAPKIQKALIGKVLRDDGGGTSDMIFDGLIWASDFGNGAVDVISMSLGFDFPGYTARLIAKGWPQTLAVSKGLIAYRDNLRIFDNLMQTIEAKSARDDGVVIVAAAGNESKVTAERPDFRIAASLPAAAWGVLSVGAAGAGEGGFVVAPFSNNMVSLCAPGVGIRSAKRGGGLVSMDGTSMACPHVAGIAALWWEKLRKESPNGKASAKKVMAKLSAMASADGFRTGIAPIDRGDGLVRAP